MIGLCGLIRWPDIDGAEELEVAYLLAPESWGRGLGTEAATAIRDHAIAELGRVDWSPASIPDNLASIRVATKIGMAYEKTFTYERPADVVVLPGRRATRVRPSTDARGLCLDRFDEVVAGPFVPGELDQALGRGRLAELQEAAVAELLLAEVGLVPGEAGSSDRTAPTAPSLPAASRTTERNSANASSRSPCSGRETSGSPLAGPRPARPRCARRGGAAARRRRGTRSRPR